MKMFVYQNNYSSYVVIADTLEEAIEKIESTIELDARYFGVLYEIVGDVMHIEDEIEIRSNYITHHAAINNVKDDNET